MKIILFLLISIIAINIFSDCLLVPPALSAIIPGGGQVYNKAYIKASLIFITEIALVYFSYDYYKENDYLNNYLFYTFIGVKLYSIIDAYIDKELSYNEEDFINEK